LKKATLTNELITPGDIVSELARIRGESERGIALLRDAETEWVALDTEATRVQYTAFLEAKGTVADKEAISRLRASEARTTAELAKVKVNYIKTKLRHLSETTMATQTAARMVELQWKTTGH
jgi:hypothetical protein